MMTLNTLLSLALMIFAGMAGGRLAKLAHLPNVTGYLVAGLLIGPSVLGVLGADSLANFDIISEVALGFIAFSIGSEFKISYFKRVGATPIVIAVFESLFAVLFVLGGLLIIGKPLSFALVLSSIAAATAPAATIMVIKQYKAKGPVSETLLSVVAIDDATALTFFGIAIAIAGALINPAETSLASAILTPLWEIGGAVVFGFLLGLIFMLPLRWFKKDGNRLALTIGFVFAGVGLSDLLGFSSLLFCMAMGAALTNLSSQAKHIAKLADSITPPIFILFFVLSGAELKLSVIPSIGLVGIVYILLRSVGKVAGAALGASMCQTEPAVRRYLGPALLPQAGVAIGLSLMATTVVPEYGEEIRAVILCGTLIYELVGPAVTKLSLTAAGEISRAEKKTSEPAPAPQNEVVQK